MKVIVLLGFLAVAMNATLAYGGVTIDRVPGTRNITSALDESIVTDGELMAGMSVSAYFADSTSESVTWVSSAASSGLAQGVNWSLSQSGNTWDQDWTLDNQTGQPLVGLVLDAGDGNAVFDTISASDFTPGSGKGKPLTMTSGDPSLDILATYYDEVALVGELPVGDLYRCLRIDFLNAGQFGSGSTMTFMTDTDSLATAGDIHPVPEPSVLVLLSMLGALGVAAWRRR
ncbi:MAG: PEP-CTERM sorting domain-containing protein [Pirellulales bacterium]|nr:PEP-CTERM sorting domain-containing protein [Pirellulales bacterium]